MLSHTSVFILELIVLTETIGTSKLAWWQETERGVAFTPRFYRHRETVTGDNDDYEQNT